MIDSMFWSTRIVYAASTLQLNTATLEPAHNKTEKATIYNQCTEKPIEAKSFKVNIQLLSFSTKLVT
jgi:membrane-bound inhibitor of C-type lysozyme